MRLEGQLDEARLILEKEIQTNPDNDRAHFELTRLLFWRLMEGDEFDSFFSGMSTLSKRLKKINSEIETNVNLNPNSARYNYWAGNISAYMLISKVHNPLKWFGIPWIVKKTKAFFEKAVELDPNHHEARAFLIRIYHGGLFLGSHSKKAEYHINEFEVRDPVYWVRAKCASLEDSACIDLLNTIIEENDQSVLGHELLARKYRNSGDSENAAIHWLKALELNPADMFALYHYTSNCLKTDKLEKCEKIVQDYLSQEKNKSGIYKAVGLRQLSRIRKKQGNKIESKKLWDEALSIDPTNFIANKITEHDLFTAP